MASYVLTSTLSEATCPKTKTNHAINIKPLDLNNTEQALLPPPPYTPPIISPPMEQKQALDTLLYQKMLSLESLVTNIHETVVDQNTVYSDVSTQLKEINDSMATFQREASIRLRKKLTGNRVRRASSVFSQETEPEAEDTELFLSPSSVEQNANETNKPEPAEDEERYDRVCSMLETLITDASSVLETSSPSPFDIPLPSDDEGLDFDDSTTSKNISYDINEKLENSYELSQSYPDSKIGSGKVDNELEVKIFCQVSRGGSVLRKHELSKKLSIPFIGANLNDDDVERIALLSNPSSELIRSSFSLNSKKQNELSQLLAQNDTGAKQFVALLYWVFLFTLGSVLLDSSLCNIAGSQVLSIVNSMSGGSLVESAIPRKRSNTLTQAPSPALFPATEESLTPTRPCRMLRRNSF